MKLKNKKISYGIGIIVLGSVVAFSLSLGLALGLDFTKGSLSTNVRFATFNVSFDRSKEGQLADELSGKPSELPLQVRNIIEIIQRSNPDVILLNEFNYDDQDKGINAFRNLLKTHSYNGSKPIDYPYYFTAPSNTGEQPSPALNFNNDGVVGGDVGSFDYANDAFGFGQFPGKYAMALLSKYPIDVNNVRTFRKFLWKDMPNNLLPTNYYSQDVQDVFRLSSKSHWDVPVMIGDKIIHVLASHPTPSNYDDAETNWNGRRNHDEIRFWTDYVNPPETPYIYDDAQATIPSNLRSKKHLQKDAMFVIMGDQNDDPYVILSVDTEVEEYAHAIKDLMESDAVNSQILQDKAPMRSGKIEDGYVKYNTAPRAPGMRIDHVIPSRNLEIVNSLVFWPNQEDELGRLVAADSDEANQKAISSDHRLVYVTVKV